MRTGLWIPVEIEVLPLSLTEKVLLSEIVSLDRVGECFASNEHFAKLLGVRADSVSRIISKLKKAGYIKQTGFDGRRRKLIPIMVTKSVPKQEPILSKVWATKPKHNTPKNKSRVGESAEAGFAISNGPIKRVHLENNVQKTWEDFLEWTSGRISKSSMQLILASEDPSKLFGSNKKIWEMWNRVNQ